MRYKNSVYTGISNDEKGYSVWVGYEKNEREVILIQNYLGQSDNPDATPQVEKKPLKVEVVWNVAAPKEGSEFNYDHPPTGEPASVPGDGTT